MTISVPINVRLMLAGAKYCFAKFLDHTTVERVQNPDAICGNVDPLLNRTATGRRKVAFTLWVDLTVPVIQYLLPQAGTTLSVATYTANQTVSTSEIIIDKGGAVHKYTNCRLARMIIRGQNGTMPISAECLFIAEDEIEDSGTSWVDGTVDNIFPFTGTTLTIGGTSFNPNSFAIAIDRKLVESWNASATVTDVGVGPRQTLFATSIPYIAANKDVYWSNRDSTTGVAIALAFTNGSDSLTFNVPKGILNPQSPSIEGALDEVRLPITFEAHRQSATAAFNFVLVSA